MNLYLEKKVRRNSCMKTRSEKVRYKIRKRISGSKDTPRLAIFRSNKDGSSPYKLVVSFPDRNQFVFSSILSVAGLSFLLTLFIIIVSTTAIYQIIRQKKISEMKM